VGNLPIFGILQLLPIVHRERTAVVKFLFMVFKLDKLLNIFLTRIPNDEDVKDGILEERKYGIIDRNYISLA